MNIEAGTRRAVKEEGHLKAFVSFFFLTNSFEYFPDNRAGKNLVSYEILRQKHRAELEYRRKNVDQ